MKKSKLTKKAGSKQSRCYECTALRPVANMVTVKGVQLCKRCAKPSLGY